MRDVDFRKLSRAEELEFRQWARDHSPADWAEHEAILHPVVRDEWHRLALGVVFPLWADAPESREPFSTPVSDPEYMP